MIEAVNALASNAPLIRASTEQVDASRAYATNPERVQESAPQAPYVSPYIAWNLDYNKAVLQIRNGETGDVENQFPSESALALKARSSAVRAAAPTREAPTAKAPTPTAAPSAPEANVAHATADVAQAQVAAAALAKGAQAGVPAVSTVITSA